MTTRLLRVGYTSCILSISGDCKEKFCWCLLLCNCTHSTLAFDDLTMRICVCAGAQNDLERVTKMAYAQVALYGMNEKVGLLSFPQDDNRLDKPYSNETARLIDDEVRQMVHKAYQRTLELLTEKRALVTDLAEQLLAREVRLQWGAMFVILWSTVALFRKFCRQVLPGFMSVLGGLR